MDQDLALTLNSTRSESESPVLDRGEIRELTAMIGSRGVAEMVAIFDVETRKRLHRLAAGGQDKAALIREMHTLKGASCSVGATRLTALGRRFEQAARRGETPDATDLRAIADALDAFLAALRARYWA